MYKKTENLASTNSARKFSCILDSQKTRVNKMVCVRSPSTISKYNQLLIQNRRTSESTIQVYQTFSSFWSIYEKYYSDHRNHFQVETKYGGIRRSYVNNNSRVLFQINVCFFRCFPSSLPASKLNACSNTNWITT